MTSKQSQLVSAAITLIRRHGIKRTSMNDIAAEASVSRQTLYNIFTNKEQVLRAAVSSLSDTTIANIESACAKAVSVDQKLDALFQYLVIEPFKFLRSTPEGAELIIGIGEVCKQELQRSHQRYRGAIENVVSPYSEEILNAGMTLKQFADYIQVSTNSIKKDASSKAHMQNLVATLKQMICGVIAPKS